ncbi:hypothetical protein OE88DRAFT_1739440 [Heliocybe sulcata]|uniref:Uncharacterized protein n=1 Tax=Heliocybe sulcata TaxID=5364 RepID=A0A5C3MNX7_9AGAM|nr:hypothetical protein OE88DRAFT_1739440 [Heliocybe sulcata]
MAAKSCQGKRTDGEDCPCVRYIPRLKQDPDQPHLCRDCGHFESAHQTAAAPPSSIGDIFAAYKEPARMHLPLKASAQDAVKETNSGFKRNAESSGSGSLVKKAKKEQGAILDEKLPRNMIKVGRVTILPDGLEEDEDGELSHSSAPAPKQYKTYEGWKLSVPWQAKDGKLAFGQKWTVKQIEAWLRGLFPEVFQYVDEQMDSFADPPARTWELLDKTGMTLSTYKYEPNGEAFESLKGAKGRVWKDRTVWIGLHVPIPPSLYMNKFVERKPQPNEDITGTLQTGEGINTDLHIEQPDLDDRKGKGKARALPSPLIMPVSEEPVAGDRGKGKAKEPDSALPLSPLQSRPVRKTRKVTLKVNEPIFIEDDSQSDPDFNPSGQDDNGNSSPGLTEAITSNDVSESPIPVPRSPTTPLPAGSTGNTPPPPMWLDPTYDDLPVWHQHPTALATSSRSGQDRVQEDRMPFIQMSDELEPNPWDDD